MRDDPIRRAFDLLDRPVQPPQEFGEKLFERLLDEATRRPHLLRHRLPPGRGPRLARYLTIAAALALALAVFVVVLPLGELGKRTGVRDMGPFGEMPPFRATLSFVVTPSEGASAGTFEVVVAYGRPDAWRYDVLTEGFGSMIPAAEGSFAVWDARALHVYDAGQNVFYEADVARPETFSILNLLAWNGPATPGWDERCAEGRVIGFDDVAGRTAVHVSCAVAGQVPQPVGEAGQVETRLDLWVDEETGVILRLKTDGPAIPFRAPFGPSPDGSLELTAVEYKPAFGPDELTFAPPPGAVPAEEPPPPPPTSLSLGEPAPTWTGQLLDGGEVDLASLRGRPTAVYFWASWCPPCVGDPLENLQAVFRERRDVLNLVSVALSDVTAETEKIIEGGGYTFPVVLDEDGGIGQVWGVQGIPTLVLLDADGRLVGGYAAPLSRDDFERALDALESGEPLPEPEAPVVSQT